MSPLMYRCCAYSICGLTWPSLPMKPGTGLLLAFLPLLMMRSVEGTGLLPPFETLSCHSKPLLLPAQYFGISAKPSILIISQLTGIWYSQGGCTSWTKNSDSVSVRLQDLSLG